MLPFLLLIQFLYPGLVVLHAFIYASHPACTCLMILCLAPPRTFIHATDFTYDCLQLFIHCHSSQQRNVRWLRISTTWPVPHDYLAWTLPPFWSAFVPMPSCCYYLPTYLPLLLHTGPYIVYFLFETCLQAVAVFYGFLAPHADRHGRDLVICPSLLSPCHAPATH